MREQEGKRKRNRGREKRDEEWSKTKKKKETGEKKKGRRRKQKRSNMLEKRGIGKGRNKIDYEGILDKDWCKGRSQTTFTRRGGYVVPKCQSFVNVYMVENVNAGG